MLSATGCAAASTDATRTRSADILTRAPAIINSVRILCAVQQQQQKRPHHVNAPAGQMMRATAGHAQTKCGRREAVRQTAALQKANVFIGALACPIARRTRTAVRAR